MRIWSNVFSTASDFRNHQRTPIYFTSSAANFKMCFYGPRLVAISGKKVTAFERKRHERTKGEHGGKVNLFWGRSDIACKERPFLPKTVAVFSNSLFCQNCHSIPTLAPCMKSVSVAICFPLSARKPKSSWSAPRAISLIHIRL